MTGAGSSRAGVPVDTGAMPMSGTNAGQRGARPGYLAPYMRVVDAP